MAWKDNLLEASFNGIVFDIVKTDDEVARATAEHSYPYVDGSDIEDMGRGARRINVEAVFYGDDYEERLQWFLAELDQEGSGELIHPVFGSFKTAQVGRYAVHHDAENPDYSTVTLDFVESTPSQPFFNRALKKAVVPQHGSAVTVSASAAAAALIERLSAANPLSGLDALRESMMGPLLYGMDVVNVTLSGLDPLAYPRAWGNDIAALVGGILDVRDWGTRLQSDWDSIQSDLNAFSIFSVPPSPAPDQVTSSATPTEAQAAAAVAATMQVNMAVGLANAASYVLDAESDNPTLLPSQLEAIVNTARTAIETAIEQVRATYNIEQSRTITEPLKGQALAVQEAAQAIIALRPQLIQRTVDAPGNMRLLAHLWHGNHNRATQLYRLNGARSPFVAAGETLYAYVR